MYAVVRTGGKQYRVTAGDIFEVEKLEGEVGDTITMEDVLLVSDGESATIGQPIVGGAAVNARITGQYRGKKILVFRYRPKKRIRVRRGHRQYLTRLEVESVSFGGVTYDTVPEKAAAPEGKPKRKKKAKKPKAAAAAPIIEETVDEAVVEETVVEETVIEETAVEEAVVEAAVEETVEEVVVEAAVEETVVEETIVEEVVVEAAVEETVEETVVEATSQETLEEVVVVAPVEEVAAKVETTAKPDDLTKIVGIGKVFQGRLRDEFGISSFAQLAEADAEKLAELCERSLEEVTGWISQAKEIIG